MTVSADVGSTQSTIAWISGRGVKYWPAPDLMSSAPLLSNSSYASPLMSTPDADQFSFDPTTRRLTNETQGKTYDPIPLTPKERSVRSLTLRVRTVTVVGPLAKEHWVRPADYDRFFPDGGVPDDPAKGAAYVRRRLREFVTRAYRRPVSADDVNELMQYYDEGVKKGGFEEGIRSALTGLLASPFGIVSPLAKVVRA